MKSKALHLFVVLSLVLTLFGVAAPAAGAAALCGTPKPVTLFAGQTIDAGTVTIANDANNLYVTFTTANGWLLSETHLHVADSLASIPQTKNGNPKIGNFAYQMTHNPYVTTYTYTIAKSALSLDAHNALVVAAHAVVVKVDAAGNVIASETGWAKGDQFNPKGSWAMYTNYTWQSCTVTPPVESKTETAFAFGGEYAKCFDKFDASNRWGWSNGALSEGSYTFDLYAGAGQCDLSKGTLVGTLSVNYANGTATVKYQMVGNNPTTGLAYMLTETHLYVGSEPLARDKQGEYTVAPGQFPYINPELNTTARTYTVSGLSGPIYVVAHATVSGFPQ